MEPKVSFIVPCYNLAHLLAECVNSILVQTYENFEVLIMDDCSPDNTPDIAQSFQDPRVFHIRNERNLRHLANYNKGIQMARGMYVWLISADDRLRSPLALEQFVTILDQHPDAGFVFCPAVGLEHGVETGLLAYSHQGASDAIFDGKLFLRKLLNCNIVVAASAMARKKCYVDLSMFPLDLPYAGDWYIWCLFALHHDVAYIAEPMANYRQHSQAITNLLKKEDNQILFQDCISVLMRIREAASAIGQDSISGLCEQQVARSYAEKITSGTETRPDLVIDELKALISSLTIDQFTLDRIVSHCYRQLADYYYTCGNNYEAKKYYRAAMQSNRRSIEAVLKFVLLNLGKVGIPLRTALSALRKRFFPRVEGAPV